jgi:hypothetical protein
LRPRALIANLAWRASSARGARTFRAALDRAAETQARLLLGYVASNRDTAFGRVHGFGGIRTVEDYQARVPLATYDDFEPLIQRIADGEAGVLTADRVERLVPSGGSTSAAKLIPFTRRLAREFAVAIDAWVSDLFAASPALLNGPAYWSITPSAAFPPARPDTAVPIGFADDTAYLGGLRQALAGAVLAVPPVVARLRDVPAFRYATVLFLLREPQLRLVSVWHPSFLDMLLDTLEQCRDRLAADIGTGAFNPPSTGGAQSPAPARSLLAPDPRRADVVRAADPGDYRALWRTLSLISAWGDGHSRGPAEALALRVPDATLQPKGLLATEGVVTLPFQGRYPLAITSHFFEFLDERDRIHLAHELRSGEDYHVVLTTGGGLYRYRLGDRVRVDGFAGTTPSLRFVGKEDRASDWFGEKLSDGFVARVLDALFRGRQAPRFALLAPERYPSGMAYTLFLDADAPRGEGLPSALERGLRQNPHYAWCMELGQLRPARVIDVGPTAAQAYVDACVSRGQRLGDVKPAALRPETGWRSILPCLTAEREVAGC